MPSRRTARWVVTVNAIGAAQAEQIGLAAYSYAHACHAFRPLLERYAPVIEIDRGESRLDARGLRHN